MKKLIAQSASFWKNSIVAQLLGMCFEIYTTQVESIPEFWFCRSVLDRWVCGQRGE